MARQRFIWPDFWTDPKLGKLEPVVQLFFIGCFSNADDDGRLLGSAAYLRSTLFPYQDLSLQEIEQIRDAAVAACPNLVLYVVEDVEYLAFAKWSDYQKPKYPKPSKLPRPPFAKRSRTSQKSSGKASGSLGEASSKKGTAIQPRVGQGREGFALEAKRSETTDETLPFEKQVAAAKLKALAPVSTEGMERIDMLCDELPQGSLEKVLESCAAKANREPLGAGYVINALRSERDELGQGAVA